MQAYKAFLILILFFQSFSFAETVYLRMDLNNGDRLNYDQMVKQLDSQTEISQIVFEFYDSNKIAKLKVNAQSTKQINDEIYKINYPNGDFYYLIGELETHWRVHNYKEYFKLAKWLALRGFKTIINTMTYTPDLQEALSNPRTTALIWDSHGAPKGEIFTANKQLIPNDIFIKYSTDNLKYILFANCYGTESDEYYQISNYKNIKSYGWKGVITNSIFIAYLQSAAFDRQLEEAFNKKLVPTVTNEIDL